MEIFLRPCSILHIKLHCTVVVVVVVGGTCTYFSLMVVAVVVVVVGFTQGDLVGSSCT